MRRRLLDSIILPLALVGFCCALMGAGRQTERAGAPERLMVENVRIVDVAAGRARPEQTIVVEDGRVKSIVASNETITKGDTTIDASGLFAMAGLFDCHVHLGGSAGANMDPREWSEAELEKKLVAFLASGVTTVRSLCDHKGQVLKMREAVATGALLGPDILCAGPAITAPGGHPVPRFRFVPGLVEAATRQIDKPEQVSPVIEELAADRVDVIKAIVTDSGGSTPKLPDELLREVVGRAHEHGLPVTAHVGSYDDLEAAVRSCADGIEHLVDSRRPLPRKLAATIAKRKPYCCPTIAVIAGIASIFDAEEVLADQWVRERVSAVVAEGLLAGRGWWHFNPKRSRKMADAAKRFLADHAAQRVSELRKAGCTIVTGTDCGNPLTFHGPSLVRELQLLGQTGMSNTEILRAATIDAARCCRVDDEYGTIEPNKIANLVLLRADPLEDLANVRKIEWVIVHGKPLRLETLLAKIAQ